MQVISREEAILKNYKTYYLGIECKRGHVCERYTSNKECIVCNKEKVLKYRKTNPLDPEVNKQKCKAWYSKNKNKKREYERTEKARRLKLHYVKLRKLRKLKATPKWADLEKIKEIYKNCPEGWHVDHIVPLQGKNVCGLHVYNNLQYLTAGDNTRKGNKFDTE